MQESVDTRPAAGPSPAGSPPGVKPVLAMEGIVKTFGGEHALAGADFSVLPGEVHALMGENGAGKSTLMKILAGIYTRNGGRVFVDGSEAAINAPADSARLGIAFVHQHPNLVPMFDVSRNIFLGREPLKGRAIDWRRMRLETEKLLAMLEIDLPPTRLIRNLTVAQRQEVAIVTALSLSPRIIVFDEPTASLSFKEVNRLFEIVAALTAKGVTIVYISHRMDEIFRISNRITVLRNGRTIGVRETAATNPGEIIKMMIGSEMSLQAKGEYHGTATVALAAKEVTTASLPEPLTVKLRRGEVLGLFGLVGAGRTEVARVLFGADRALSGTIEVGGRPVRSPSPSAMMRNGVAFVPEDRHGQGLVMDMTIGENASLASLAQYRWGPFIRRRLERNTVRALSSRLALKAASLGEPVTSLSGGNQQKVVLTKWLAREPKVFIFDDPTVGIDVGTKGEIYNLVNNLAKEGAAVLFISSEPEEMFRVADRILVMYRKRVVGEYGAGGIDVPGLMAAATGAVS